MTDDKWQCQRDDKGWEQTERESSRVRPNLLTQAQKEASNGRFSPRSAARLESPLRKAF